MNSQFFTHYLIQASWLLSCHKLPDIPKYNKQISGKTPSSLLWNKTDVILSHYVFTQFALFHCSAWGQHKHFLHSFYIFLLYLYDISSCFIWRDTHSPICGMCCFPYCWSNIEKPGRISLCAKNVNNVSDVLFLIEIPLNIKNMKT